MDRKATRGACTSRRASLSGLSETLQILADPDAMEQLRESIADIEAGRVGTCARWAKSSASNSCAATLNGLLPSGGV